MFKENAINAKRFIRNTIIIIIIITMIIEKLNVGLIYRYAHAIQILKDTQCLVVMFYVF